MSDFGSEPRLVYYKLLFPWHVVESKLYRHGMDVGVLYDNDVWDRRLSMTNFETVKQQVLKRNPKEIHFGAQWKSPGKSTSDDNFMWRPFVIDLDMPDYAMSAPGGGGEKYNPFRTLNTPDRNPMDPHFRKSWVFIEIAVEIIDKVLERDFGFTQRKWVFSGNKGVHCHVLDERACALGSFARAAIFNYFVADSGLFNATYEPRCHMSSQWAASIKSKIFERSPYMQFCYSVIREKMSVLLDDQGLWGEATQQILGVAYRDGSEAATERLGGKGTPLWRDYERASYIYAVEFALKVAMPRLDPHQKQAGHMAKIPFSVHHKSGKIAVPFDPSRVDIFDPALSPSLQDVLEFHDIVSKGGQPHKGKNFDGYVHWFADEGILKRKAADAGDAPPAKAQKGLLLPPQPKQAVPSGLRGLFKSDKA